MHYTRYFYDGRRIFWLNGLGGSILKPEKQISTELGYMTLIKDCEGNWLALRAQQ